ncbi:hypothetical protein T439DRAFT_282584, partial [Meredithblackwellia eburnea MCA 4105]
GVEIPTKPEAPKEGECCMSGCAHCIYDIYVEDLEFYHEQIVAARKALLAKGSEVSAAEWPEELGERAMDDTSSPKEADPKAEAERALQETYKTLDPSMRAFLEMEARLKKKQKDAQPSV